jgi:hypothetical protein
MKNEINKTHLYEFPIEELLMKELEGFALVYELDKWKLVNKILVDGLKRKKSMFRSIEKQKESLGGKK